MSNITSNSYSLGTFASHWSLILAPSGWRIFPKMQNTCSTGAEEAASAKYSLLGWKVHGNGPQRSSATKVCSWFLPVLVPPSRQLSQVTRERLSAMAVS